MKNQNKSLDRKTLSFLSKHLKTQWKLLSLSYFCALGGAAVSIMIGEFLKKFVDEALQQKNWQLVQVMCGQLVLIFFFDSVMDFTHRFSLRVGIERSIRFIRNEVFDKLLIFSHAQVSRYTSGKAVSRILNDTQVLGLGNHLLADLMKEPLSIVAILGYLLYLHWQLTVVCLISIPLIALIGGAFGRSARRNQSRLQNSLEESSNHIIETMGGLRTAHSLGQTQLLGQEFMHKNTMTYNFLIRLAKVEELVGPLTKWFTSIMGAILVMYGAHLVVSGSLSIGSLVAYLGVAGMLLQPLRQMNSINVRVQQLLATGRRLYDIYDEPLDNLARAQEQRAKHPQTNFRGEALPCLDLEWSNVSFAYPQRNAEDGSSPLALENISLSLKAGERLALVGRSGSGKSTLSLLAMRFLDPNSGSVLLDGKNSQQWELPLYRQNFSYVSQDVFLFNRSIKNNLLMAAPHSTEAQLWDALEKAQIREFFEKLPQKLDTVLGEHASTLSGGERQRLAIARAFLRNSPILVLDEATSQLDAHSEAAVQKALGQLMKNRSVLIIAHRLSTVREANTVAVLDHGRVLEIGNPQNLLTQKTGAFAKLWQQQFSGLQ